MARLSTAAGVTSWKHISKLVSNGHYQEALLHYSQAHASNLPPNAFTFPCLLKSCAQLRAASPTLQIHAQLAKSGFASNPYMATALIHAYARIGFLVDARKVFDEMPARTLPCFNALIAGLSQCGEFDASKSVVRLLVKEGFLPNSITVASMLPACGAVEQGEQLHGLVVKTGHCLDRYVVTALIMMYLDCGDLGSARRLLELAVDKGVESYNAMASGLLRKGKYCMALDIVREMIIGSSEEPNATTLLVVLSACSSMSASSHGKEVHCYLLKHAMDRHIMLGTTLIDLYSKCGSLEWAHRLFLRMENRNLVVWNAMISGFLIHGELTKALEFFEQLKLDGFKPDIVTWNLMINGLSHHGKFVEVFSFFSEMQSEGVSCPSLKTMTNMLHACSAMSDLQHGKEIYGHVIRTMKDFDDVFQTTVINMFMSCGYDAHAGRVFEKNMRRSADPAMWNAMIFGYGKSGKSNLALKIFNEMIEQQVQPNSATFLCVLSACSHAGLVQKATHIYQIMGSTYNINPTVEHLSVMVDLLCRAGKLSEACNLLLEYPDPAISMWYSFLSACRNYSYAQLGEIAAMRLYDLDPSSATPWVTLSNIYAVQNRWSEMERMRKMMLDKGLFKVPGYSGLV